jgi:hypothetical protein
VLDKLQAGGDVSLVLAAGGACRVNVPRAQLFQCIQKAIHPEGAAGSEAEKAAASDLQDQNPVATAASENAAQAASEARADLAVRSPLRA